MPLKPRFVCVSRGETRLGCSFFTYGLVKMADGEENKLRSTANISGEGLTAQPAWVSHCWHPLHSCPCPSGLAAWRRQAGRASGGSGGGRSPVLCPGCEGCRASAAVCKTEKASGRGYSSGALGAAWLPPERALPGAGRTHPWSPCVCANTATALVPVHSTHGLLLHGPGRTAPACWAVAAGECYSSREMSPAPAVLLVNVMPAVKFED